MENRIWQDFQRKAATEPPWIAWQSGRNARNTRPTPGIERLGPAASVLILTGKYLDPSDRQGHCLTWLSDCYVVLIDVIRQLCVLGAFIPILSCFCTQGSCLFWNLSVWKFPKRRMFYIHIYHMFRHENSLHLFTISTMTLLPWPMVKNPEEGELQQTELSLCAPHTLLGI